MNRLNDLQKKYFKIRYGDRINATIDCLQNSEKISELKDITKSYPITNKFIEEKLTIDTYMLKGLKEDFREYHELYTQYYNNLRTDLFLNPVELVNWFSKQENSCGYCGVTGTELQEIVKKRNGNLTLNNKKKRSKGTLEIERLDSVSNKYDFYNIILACPLCNNAKSNLIDEDCWRELFRKPMQEYYKKLLSSEECKNN